MNIVSFSVQLLFCNSILRFFLMRDNLLLWRLLWPQKFKFEDTFLSDDFPRVITHLNNTVDNKVKRDDTAKKGFTKKDKLGPSCAKLRWSFTLQNGDYIDPIYRENRMNTWWKYVKLDHIHNIHIHPQLNWDDLSFCHIFYDVSNVPDVLDYWFELY